MGMNRSGFSNLPTHFFHYSSFLGYMYLSTPENENAVKEAKALVGEDAVKLGYQEGSDTPTGKARAFLSDKKLNFDTIDGYLVNAGISHREVNGRKYPYLYVVLEDEEGRYMISTSLAGEAAQRLTRKLAVCEPGMYTVIGLFAQMEDIREGQERAYPKHYARVAQGEDKDELVKIEGIDPKVALQPQVEEAVKKAQDAGVEDKDALYKIRSNTELKYHLGLMTGIQAEFEKFRNARKQRGEAMPVEEAPPASFEDLPEDMPV